MMNIGLVDDHLLFRQSLKNFINQRREEDIKVVFEAYNGEELKAFLQFNRKVAHHLHLVLLDLQMPVMDGRSTVSFLRIHYPSIKIIGLSAFFNEYLVTDFLRRGAQGYVSKNADIDTLIKAIYAVMNDKIFIENNIQERSDTPSREPLSEKQITFLRYCISELSYREIADNMCLSPKTIDNYRDELFRKLNIKSRTGLVLYAIKAGLEAF